METFLYIVFFISCIVMVAAVLLQPGKTDAGALFTSGVSSAAMNPRGTASVLSKLTIITATIFMLSALLLSLPSLTGNVSVLQTQGEDDTAPAVVDTNTNANTADTNTNSNNESNSSTNNSETKTDEENSEEKSDDTNTEEKSADEQNEDAEEVKAEDKQEESK